MTPPAPGLVLATAADLERLLPLVAAYHAYEGIGFDDDTRRRVLGPLLEGPQLGRVWLITLGGELAGYVAVCFGYSIEFRGRDAFLEEVFVVERHRGKGVGGAALEQVCHECAVLGVHALHLEVARDNGAARRLYAGAGFEARQRYHLMTRRLACGAPDAAAGGSGR